jgi:hypothetical protein
MLSRNSAKILSGKPLLTVDFQKSLVQLSPCSKRQPLGKVEIYPHSKEGNTAAILGKGEGGKNSVKF